MSEWSNTDKLAVVAHYVIARTLPHELGATKLNKILWFADCLAYERLGRSLTGLTEYRRLDQGPVPHGLDNVLDKLAAQGVIARRIAPSPGYPRKEFFSLQEPPLEQLDATEVDLLHIVIDYVRTKSAREVSDLSHDALWQETPHLGWMSVAGGSVRIGEVDADQLAWAEQELRHAGAHA
jgi:Protein of unknown function (DUF4065)